VTTWYHCIAEDSRISKMPVINPLQALVHPQTQKKTILHRLSIPNPNFWQFAFFCKQICRLGIVDFNLPSNWWVSQLQKSEFTVLVLGFESLGFELDNCGRTTKNAYCRIYRPWLWYGSIEAWLSKCELFSPLIVYLVSIEWIVGDAISTWLSLRHCPFLNKWRVGVVLASRETWSPFRLMRCPGSLVASSVINPLVFYPQKSSILIIVQTSVLYKKNKKKEKKEASSVILNDVLSCWSLITGFVP
jgi:hypothetical protein